MDSELREKLDTTAYCEIEHYLEERRQESRELLRRET